jgi:hypothetical protein
MRYYNGRSRPGGIFVVYPARLPASCISRERGFLPSAYNDQMPGPMNAEELRAWRERWDVVNERQREELRRMTPAEKFEQLSRLMSSARMFDMVRRKPADDAARAQWARLQSRFLARG